ncbi:MAG: TonB-dependent receptor [Gammaproteobacteria bacterium]|jgi:outer membrane receptor protein involved in Fe transport
MPSRTAFVVSLALALTGAAAWAQDALEEIIVTSTKREATLQDVPVAVTVVAGEELEQAQILDLLDLQTVVPALRVTQLQTSTQTNFLIRGFGNGANNPGIESSVGVFVDGVYRSRSASQIGDLLDIERIEVVRGPQSTLFGQNASAGVISIVTRLPDREFNGTLDVSLGNYNGRLIRGRVSGPLGDRTAYSLTGSINQRDGYFDELSSGAEINDRDRRDLRGQLRFDASDSLSVRIIADTSRIDEACCGVVNLLNGPTGALIQAVGGNIYTGDPFERQGYLDSRPVNEVDNDGLSTHVEWDAGAVRLESISAYRQQDARFAYDADFTSAELVPDNTNLQQIDTFTQEFRLSGEGNGSLSWLLGAYLLNEDVSYDSRIPYGDQMRAYMTGLIAAQTGDPSVLDSLEDQLGLPAGTFFAAGQGSFVDTDQSMNSYSLFGQMDWTIGARTTLTLGVAYTSNDKDVSLSQSNTDVFSSLNFVDIGFAGAFGTLTGGLPPTPDNIAANPVAAATADFISVTPCSATNPPPGCNTALALYPLQFLHPVVPFSSSGDDSEITYTVRVSHDVTDTMSVYAGIATGFKATSWNLSRDSKPFPPAEPDRSPLGGYLNPYYGRYGTRYAGPEESTALELGMKAQWDRAVVNLAIFDQEIKGFQSNIFTGTGFSLSNAGKQSTEGLEVEVVLRPGDRWDLMFSGLFMDPIYDSFVNAPGPDGPTDLSGAAPAGLHEESVSLGFAHYFMLGRHEGFVRADYLYESRVQVVDNIPASIAAREVGTLNASLGFTIDDWVVRLWGRNLNDDDYLISAFPSVAQPGSVSGYTNAPRTVGVSIALDF